MFVKSLEYADNLSVVLDPSPDVPANVGKLLTSVTSNDVISLINTSQNYGIAR